MLLNGVPLQETKSSNDLSNLDKFLENENLRLLTFTEQTFIENSQLIDLNN